MCTKTLIMALTVLLLGACASKPMIPWTQDTPPQALVPVANAGIDDQRGRFREIYCEVLESRGNEWPDYRPCNEALTMVGREPEGTGAPVDLGKSKYQSLLLVVPGVGWECMAEWLNMKYTIEKLLNFNDFESKLLDVDGLSSSANNARQIRDYIETLPSELASRKIVLIGYSKGAPDILEAMVNYPELHERVVAVISVAGAVGGSPLANTAEQKDLNVMQYFPGSKCSEGDGGALESLRPSTRRTWLTNHPLPRGIPYYSLVTYPRPDRMSSVLGSSYRKLSEVDARNDSQVIYYDQMIPNSTLIAYANADHWAIAVPVARTHEFLGSTLVDKNDYPREAFLEALLRFLEEDLAQAE
jgi:pimeloyl-ACP methyl ester carboxylesterase